METSIVFLLSYFFLNFSLPEIIFFLVLTFPEPPGQLQPNSAQIIFCQKFGNVLVHAIYGAEIIR